MTDLDNISAVLRDYATRYETAEFLRDDPSRFMHEVEGMENRETMAFIASCLSYGSRKQFFPKIRYVLDVSGGDVYEWVRSGHFFCDIPDDDKCYYRLYTNHTMIVFLRALRAMLVRHGTIGDYVRSSAHDGYSAVCAVTSFFASMGVSGVVPKDASSACKRVCMFLRWMVRDGSPVDLGLWNGFIDKRSLIVPMDTHVVHEAAALGLIDGRSASMAAARRLTARLAEVFPDDPLKGDFALFGYGVNK